MCRFPKRDLRIARPRGAYTIKRSLGLTGHRPPKSQKVIADMERLIEKMVQEEFASLPARLVLVQKKKRKSVGDGEEEPEPKRTCTVLTPLGASSLTSSSLP